ncbi:MAG: hypothetical protein EBU90_10035 [Proteobacteria bacterium]|nr:hypothetical protein [Pseudomonadota bacterium]NBP16221.1 hypothetical protein [bacterium]
MLLKEFIYFDRKHLEMKDDQRYDSDRDVGVMYPDDVRKHSRLTLGMINNVRKATEARMKERKEDLALVRKMYAAPPPEAAPT